MKLLDRCTTYSAQQLQSWVQWKGGYVCHCIGQAEPWCNQWASWNMNSLTQGGGWGSHDGIGNLESTLHAAAPSVFWCACCVWAAL
jgi:hypothetical protein